MLKIAKLVILKIFTHGMYTTNRFHASSTIFTKCYYKYFLIITQFWATINQIINISSFYVWKFTRATPDKINL